jgi:hypothetical protein
MTVKNAIPKFIALLLLSIVVALFAMSADEAIIAKIDSMSATQYAEYSRKLYHHSFLHHFLLWLCVGGFYVAIVEFVAYLISRFAKRPAA